MEDIEQVNTDVQTEVSSEPQSQPVEQVTEASAEQSTQASQPIESAPFHEHPRFRELVEQKNQYAKQVEQLMSRLESLEKTQSSPSKQAQEDALISRLKGIDPEFGNRFESLDKSLKELDSLRSWKQDMEARDFRNNAISKFDELTKKANISEDVKDIYKSMLENSHYSGNIKNIGDLEVEFNKIHESLGKRFETMKRATTAQFVQDKKSDASKPSQPKGGTVKPGGFEWSKDTATQKQQLIKRILQEAKSSNEV